MHAFDHGVQVGDPSVNYWSDPEWSQPTNLNFVTRVENLSSARFAVYGDMGLSAVRAVSPLMSAGTTDVSDNTITQLVDLAVSGGVDFMFHIGDLAYSDGLLFVVQVIIGMARLSTIDCFSGPHARRMGASV